MTEPIAGEYEYRDAEYEYEEDKEPDEVREWPIASELNG
jgi:hypothetical protein